MPMLVPSKGALRLLRHIAYASSAGAGLVVEARRRRICAVEELHDNAKKIRSSRKYHSAATVNGIEQLCSPENESNRIIELKWSEESAVTQMPHLPRQRRTKAKGQDSRDVYSLAPESGLFPAMPTRLALRGRAQSRTSPVVQVYEQVSTSIIASQDAAIYQIDKLLVTGDIKSAVGKFIASFRHHECVDAAISDTARRLSIACKEANSLMLADKVSRKLAEAGLIFQLRRGNSRFEEGIKKLLAESRVEEAVAMFMARTRGKDFLIDEKAMKTVDSLSLATLRTKQWRLTNEIFCRLYSMGYEDSNGWTRLLQVHGESKQYKAVIDLYDRFIGHFEPNHIVLAVVLRALIAQLRLLEAETLLKSALKPPWLPLRSCFTILLGGVWRVTKDLSRTIELFEWMETWFCRYRPSAALFNAMIQACVEAGRTDSAAFYAQLMKDKYGLQPNVKTHAHFLLAKAKSGDWRGVDTGLRKIHEDKLELTQNDASAFNPLLIESSRTRSLNDTENFLLSAIENYGIVPDLKTFNIMSSAFVRAGELTSLARIVECMKTVGLQPDATTFNTAFHQLWRDTKAHHMELYRICSKVQRSNRALVNERTKNTIRHAMAHDYRKGFSPVTHYSKIKTFIGQRSNDCHQQDAKSVHLDMVIALSQNITLSREEEKRKTADNVLRIYNTAKASGMQISREMVETAFQASLHKGDFERGMELVRSAHEDGIDCAGLLPLVFSNMPNEVKHLQDFLLQMYRERDDCGLEIKHHISVTAAFLLVESRRSHAAVDILTRVMQSEWGKRKPLDIVGMSVLMKAYAGLKDAEGVKRVVDTVLSRRMQVDTPFIRSLKGAVALLESVNKGGVREQSKKITKLPSTWVKDCIVLKKEQMKERQMKGEVILNIFSDRLCDVTKSGS
ncbi:MAG: hypothetical protein M1813_001441 [Trichoglossum hirsutum]|nr:MAG: hypothetical protein M1813_001441 [Trichoglossum hirsutum]